MNGRQGRGSLKLRRKARAVTLSLGVPRHGAATFHPMELKLYKGMSLRKEGSEQKAKDQGVSLSECLLLKDGRR